MTFIEQPFIFTVSLHWRFNIQIVSVNSLSNSWRSPSSVFAVYHLALVHPQATQIGGRQFMTEGKA